jgi:hypothetical protein
MQLIYADAIRVSLRSIHKILTVEDCDNNCIRKKNMEVYEKKERDDNQKLIAAVTDDALVALSSSTLTSCPFSVVLNISWSCCATWSIREVNWSEHRCRSSSLYMSLMEKTTFVFASCLNQHLLCKTAKTGITGNAIKLNPNEIPAVPRIETAPPRKNSFHQCPTNRLAVFKVQ